MEWISENSPYILLAGVVIVSMSMLRLMVQRMRKTAEKDRQREAAIQAAKEAERRRQQETALPKASVVSPKTRAPLGDPLGTPFAGGVSGIAAKWEAEVHQIGRQIIGQIDCKMAALQAITQDANRTANRLEMLVEHLEQIARKQIEWQRQQQGQIDLSGISPNVLPAPGSALDATPLTDVLKDLDGIRQTIRQGATYSEPPTLATVLRPVAEDSPTKTPGNFRSEVEMLLNYGIDPPEIARRLNISPAEVDLVMQVQQNNQLYRTP